MGTNEESNSRAEGEGPVDGPIDGLRGARCLQTVLALARPLMRPGGKDRTLLNEGGQRELLLACNAFSVLHRAVADSATDELGQEICGVIYLPYLFIEGKYLKSSSALLGYFGQHLGRDTDRSLLDGVWGKDEGGEWACLVEGLLHKLQQELSNARRCYAAVSNTPAVSRTLDDVERWAPDSRWLVSHKCSRTVPTMSDRSCILLHAMPDDKLIYCDPQNMQVRFGRFRMEIEDDSQRGHIQVTLTTKVEIEIKHLNTFACVKLT